jgi:hypothetical protein
MVNQSIIVENWLVRGGEHRKKMSSSIRKMINQTTMAFNI